MPPASPLLLGLDIGSSHTKALLLDRAGNEVASAVVPTPFVTSGRGTDTTVAALHTALDDVITRLGPDRHRTVAVGIAGIAESGAPLDGAGRPLGPVIAWHDRRGEDVVAHLDARFGPGLAHRIGQRVRPVSSVAKLGWLIGQGVTGVTRWLGVPELGLAALTGAHRTEFSLAARTGCWDVGTGRWLPAVAEAAGFDVGVFAEVAPAGEPMGHVGDDGTAWSGVAPGVPVTLAGHDHLVGAIGVGAGFDDLANSVGTAETVLSACHSQPDVSAVLEAGMALTVAPGGAGRVVLSGVARSGLALETVAATLGRSYESLDRAARNAPLLDAPGLRESLRRRDAPALPDGADGAVWRTLLDALAALSSETVEQLSALTGSKQRLVVFGGGTMSDAWMQAKARHVRLPVWRTSRRRLHAVARGSALMAGVAAGWWPDPAAGPTVALEPVRAGGPAPQRA